MAQVIEVPGMGNVEFPDDMNESDIADAIDNHLAGQHQQAMSDASAVDVGMAAIPAAMAASPALMRGAQSVGQGFNTAKTLATPAVSAGWDLAKTYMTNPKTAFVDLAAGHMGLPPPTATEKGYKGLNQTYQAIQDWTRGQGAFQPKPPGGAGAFNQMANALAQKENAINTAVHQHIAQNPGDLARFQQNFGNPEALQQTLQQVQSEQAAKTAQTAANAAKISGPASGEGATFMQRMAKQFGGMAQQVAPILNNPVTRGVAKIGGVGGQFATYSPGLNTNEEAELARRRGMGATIKPFGQ